MPYESDFQTKFTRWAKYHVKTPAAFELKLSKTSSISFDQVAPHQIAALLSVKHNFLAYKIPDTGLGAKPFDFFVLSGSAYIVVMFYKRGQKEFFMIDVDAFILERDGSSRKSLTEDRARAIGRSCLLA